MRFVAVWLMGLFCCSAWGGAVGVASVEGTIGPATADYLVRVIDEAAQRNLNCLVIRLDTPGGLLDSTKIIVQKMLAGGVPTVVYVAPSGAGAGSAGTFITLAADVAAMAPATTIGAAHPVSLGGGAGEEKPDSVMKQKLENYAVSWIEAIAARRQRNVQWAASAVRDSASITSAKALDLKVIEIIADDLPDLLKKLDGRKIEGRTLQTAGAVLVELPMNAREKVFQSLWRPEVMFILMLIAMYGIIGELSSPGAILPGVGGAIALVLMLYMSSVLPVNAAGLALIGLAMAFFVVDLFAANHGILTFGGVIAFFLGSLMLFEHAEPMWRLSLSLVLPATLLTAAFFLWIVGSGLKAQLRPAQTGVQLLVGMEARVVSAITPQSGSVHVEGEYWNARSATLIPAGQRVRVLAVDQMCLQVQPLGEPAAKNI